MVEVHLLREQARSRAGRDLQLAGRRRLRRPGDPRRRADGADHHQHRRSDGSEQTAAAAGSVRDPERLRHYIRTRMMSERVMMNVFCVLKSLTSSAGLSGVIIGDSSCTGVDASTNGNAGCMIASTGLDRKSTRLNSSHLVISYAVFCL